jgi:hypothetical protein
MEETASTQTNFLVVLEAFARVLAFFGFTQHKLLNKVISK